MKSGSLDSNYSDDEITRRRDEALLRALKTPPKHHSEMKLGKRKGKAKNLAKPTNVVSPRVVSSARKRAPSA